MSNQFYQQKPFSNTNTPSSPGMGAGPAQPFAHFPPAMPDMNGPFYGGPGNSIPPASTSNGTSHSPDTNRPEESKKRRLLIGIAIGGLVIILGAVFIGAEFILKSSANVTLYQVNVQNVTQYVGGGGIVFPRQQFSLTYPEAEQAVSVLVQAGDTVSLNQPLIKLNSAQLNVQVQQASDDATAAQAYLDSVSASGNPLTIAQAQRQYSLAESKYNSLVAQASSLTLHNGALVAPLSGVVTEVDINSGEVFTANTSLLTIMDESSVIVHVKVPLTELGQVHVGQVAQVTPSALPNITLNGQVSSIIPQADAQTDTFEVWVTVPNQNKQLLPGMSAFVRIQSPGRAIVVPRLAVLNPDRDSVVFVVQNGHAYMRRVHVTGHSASTVYVDSGLSSGDDVVLVGVYLLNDGQSVRVNQIENKQ